jgi:hypothetical protein
MAPAPYVWLIGNIQKRKNINVHYQIKKAPTNIPISLEHIFVIGWRGEPKTLASTSSKINSEENNLLKTKRARSKTKCAATTGVRTLFSQKEEKKTF